MGENTKNESIKMAAFSQDLNVTMTEVTRLLAHWGLKGWREYLIVRVPDKPESFIVLAHPSDKSDFADQLVKLHKENCGQESSAVAALGKILDAADGLWNDNTDENLKEPVAFIFNTAAKELGLARRVEVEGGS